MMYPATNRAVPPAAAGIARDRRPRWIDTYVATISATEGNIIADGGDFVAVDWELARADGFPLWDLMCVAVSTLPLVDRALYEESTRREDEYVRHLGDLFRGHAASSAVFLRWLRSVADASRVEPAIVPEIVTLWFLWYSEQWAGWAPLERFTSEWLASPELGMSWPLWRDSTSSYRHDG